MFISKTPTTLCIWNSLFSSYCYLCCPSRFFLGPFLFKVFVNDMAAVAANTFLLYEHGFANLGSRESRYIIKTMIPEDLQSILVTSWQKKFIAFKWNRVFILRKPKTIIQPVLMCPAMVLIYSHHHRFSTFVQHSLSCENISMITCITKKAYSRIKFLYRKRPF